MMYFVTRVNFNKDGQQSNSIQMFTDETLALKRFHTLIGADIDNENYTYELVQVVKEDGLCIESYTIDNRG